MIGAARFILVMIVVSALAGCRYSRHYGRVGEDRRPLDLIDEYRVPRIELGKSTREELAGLLRPTVMTVWFQPRKTKMGDIAGGYPLRVQVMPDGFADEKPSFSYGSPEVPKTAIESLKPKRTWRGKNPSSGAPLIRKLGELRPEDFKLPVQPGESDLGSVIPEYIQQPRPQKKSSKESTEERLSPVSQAKPREKATDIKALALEALQSGVKASPSPPGPAAPAWPGGLDPKLKALEHLQQIFKRGQ